MFVPRDFPIYLNLIREPIISTLIELNTSTCLGFEHIFDEGAYLTFKSSH